MRRRLCLALLLCLFVLAPAHARELRIGIAGSAPWLVGTPHDQPSGFSVQLWQAVASRLSLQYKFVPLNSIDEELQAVINGSIDIAVGPIGITSQRAQHIAFTQPYFAASLGILTLGTPPTVWQRARPFVSAAFVVLVAGLILVIFIVGNIVWLVERRHNPGIPEEWAPGVANGMWMAVVTMTTVGYGDRVPMTPLGRVATGIWMIVATVMVSTLTASITTALTVSNLGTTTIKNAESLAGKRVAVISGTVGEDFAHSFHSVVTPAPTLHDAVQLVLDKRADAVVYDEPTLRYYMLQHPDVDLALMVASFDVQSFGYALPLNSPMVRDINITLLGLAESGMVRQIRQEWFSTRASKLSDTTKLQPAPTAGLLPPANDFKPANLPTTAPSAAPTP